MPVSDKKNLPPLSEDQKKTLKIVSQLLRFNLSKFSENAQKLFDHRVESIFMQIDKEIDSLALPQRIKVCQTEYKALSEALAISNVTGLFKIKTPTRFIPKVTETRDKETIKNWQEIADYLKVKLENLKDVSLLQPVSKEIEPAEDLTRLTNPHFQPANDNWKQYIKPLQQAKMQQIIKAATVIEDFTKTKLAGFLRNAQLGKNPLFIKVAKKNQNTQANNFSIAYWGIKTFHQFGSGSDKIKALKTGIAQTKHFF